MQKEITQQEFMMLLEDIIEATQHANYSYKTPSDTILTYQPFFSAIQVVNQENISVNVSNGTLMHKKERSHPIMAGRMEIRMGDYAKGGGSGYGVFGLSSDFNKDVIRESLERAADDTFAHCRSNYHFLIGHAMEQENPEKAFHYLTKEKPQHFIEPSKEFTVDLDSITQQLKEITANGRNKDIITLDASFFAYKKDIYFINSEGSKIITSDIFYRMSMELMALDPERRLIPHETCWYSKDRSTIPDTKTLLEKKEEIIEEALEIIHSPIESNGAYPTILDPENHSVLWHEVVGHALEGHRLQPEINGDICTLFEDKTGKKIVNPIISVYDDPTADMFGHYKFDDEGVAAKKTTLIKDGILQNYLHNRESAAFQAKITNRDIKSNGHARAQLDGIPTPRMSNLIIESNQSYPSHILKEALMQVCEEMGEPYGLYIKGTMGGSTLPENAIYNTFPKEVFRIYPDGKEERVRGIYIVGTPFETLRNLIATGDDIATFDGYCGAESGHIPSSQKAPSALFTSVEFNKFPESSYQKLSQSLVNAKKR